MQLKDFTNPLDDLKALQTVFNLNRLTACNCILQLLREKGTAKVYYSAVIVQEKAELLWLWGEDKDSPKDSYSYITIDYTTDRPPTLFPGTNPIVISTDNLHLNTSTWTFPQKPGSK